MSLKVIGSGFGRTGTMSMKEVLGVLGLGPCHHMLEVMENPAQLPYWKAIAAGEQVNWADVFEGYNSQVDWPGAHVWHETAIAFPDARVIHTERPEDVWWNSFNGTIGKFFATYTELELPPHIADVADTMSGWFLNEVFEDFTDRDSAIAAYRMNNEKVRDTIPADRLLVFNVADGWDPLCRFLELPVPDTAFPHRHPKKEFWEHFGGEPA
jgi:hypothetical protein